MHACVKRRGMWVPAEQGERAGGSQEAVLTAQAWRRLVLTPWLGTLTAVFIKLKLQYFGHLMQRVDSLEKTLDAERDLGQEEKGRTEDEMAGWLH